MDYLSFLERVIDEGIEAAKADYTKPEDRPRLEGSIAGFEACRGLDPAQLQALLRETGRASISAANEAFEDPSAAATFGWVRCAHAEVEWVCNVMSAGISGIQLVPPTARGVMKAAEILGVAE